MLKPEEPTAVQRAIDQVREDLVFLKGCLEGSWKEQPDLYERIENWRFNTWRHMEEILQ